MTLRARNVAPLEDEMDAPVGTMRNDVRVAGKSGRELPLELHHLRGLPLKRDQPRVPGRTASELKTQGGQGLGERGEVHEGTRPPIAERAEHPKNHDAPTGSHLGSEPARVPEAIVHV